MSFHACFDTRESLRAARRLVVAALLGSIIVMVIAAAAHADCSLTNEGRAVCGLHSSHLAAQPTTDQGRVTKRSRHHRKNPPARRGRFVDPNGNPVVRVQTAAGIEIKVAASFAPKIQGFISDLVARGYKPRAIHCHAHGGHVRGSLHYRGEACDFDQRGWNRTAHAMYRVRDLARAHGLRDGCSFGDCGHIDSGGPLRIVRRGSVQ